MERMSAVRWLVRCGLSAALAVACLRSGHRLVRQQAASAGDDHARRHADHVEPLCREPIPDVVLVGSSLTFRLKEEYFATPRLRNLALAGGSPVTGLEIVANQPRLPKLVLIEANGLSRAADTALVEKYSERRRRAAVLPPDQDGCRGL